MTREPLKDADSRAHEGQAKYKQHYTKTPRALPLGTEGRKRTGGQNHEPKRPTTTTHRPHPSLAPTPHDAESQTCRAQQNQPQARRQGLRDSRRRLRERQHYNLTTCASRHHRKHQGCGCTGSRRTRVTKDRANSSEYAQQIRGQSKGSRGWPFTRCEDDDKAGSSPEDRPSCGVDQFVVLQSQMGESI